MLPTKLPRGYSTITLDGKFWQPTIQRLKEILYTGDLETCKYMADKHATGIVRVVVVNERGQLQYSA